MVTVTVIGVYDLLTVTLRPWSNTEKRKKKKKVVFLFSFFIIKLLWINDENRPIPAWGPAKNGAKELWGGEKDGVEYGVYIRPPASSLLQSVE